jgi:cell division transport system permease protein
MAARIERDNRVANVEIITPEQALAEFRTQSGLEAALGLLEENPLPAVLSVTVSSDLTPQQVGALADELAQRPNIERMRLDHEWVERLHALMNLAERALGVLAALLAVAVVLVIGNTIRLTIENRREEIEIIKLIGGSNGFVRRPFLYEGFWYGFSGGALAWFLTEWGRWSIKQPAQRLAETYGGGLTLHGIGLNDSLVLLCGGGVLGVLGAWIAVARHLTAIEPR